MLGGGTFTAQNKVIPGAYINVISMSRASASLSDRGTATVPIELDWGAENAVITVTAEDFDKNCLKLFGYARDTAQMRNLREVFMNAHTVYIYRLGNHTKAENTFAKAKYGGTRGNDIKIIIQSDVDNADSFNVITAVSGTVRDTQTVKTASELINNDWVEFKSGSALAVTAGEALTGGANGTVDGESYQEYVNAIEPYSFNVLGCATTDDTIKGFIASFTKRMREEQGIKFQTVLYDYAKADYYGVISVKNRAVTPGVSAGDGVYWLTGAEASCGVNESLMNMKYDGELEFDTSYTQTELATLLSSGNMLFHKAGDEIRILDDVNTLVTVTDEIGEDFKSNQTMRVLDQLANDTALVFNTKYLGKWQNTEVNRMAFKNDILRLYKSMYDINAIDEYESEDITVDAGENKKDVIANTPITPALAMARLYMTIICR